MRGEGKGREVSQQSSTSIFKSSSPGCHRTARLTATRGNAGDAWSPSFSVGMVVGSNVVTVVRDHVLLSPSNKRLKKPTLIIHAFSVSMCLHA